MPSKVSRKKLLIYPRFQYSLLFINTMTLLLAFSFMSVQIYLSFQKLFELGTKQGLPPDHIFFRFLQFHAESLTKNLVLSMVFATVLSTILIVIVSHRMAGPIVRLKSYLQAFLEHGYTKKLTFRKNDYFSDLPDIINDTLDKIESNNKHF